MSLYRVTRPWVASYPDPLVVAAGDRLTVGDSDDGWPGWVWCKSRNGKAGWVPQTWLQTDGKKGIVLRDYVARELDLSEGEFVDGLLVESGWLWAATLDGREGWVPLECVAPLDGDSSASAGLPELPDDPYVDDRLRAIRALAESGDGAALGRLEARLRRVENEREALQAAIRKLERSGA